jgi:sarcosine oxidase delta subunit
MDQSEEYKGESHKPRSAVTYIAIARFAYNHYCYGKPVVLHPETFQHMSCCDVWYKGIKDKWTPDPNGLH